LKTIYKNKTTVNNIYTQLFHIIFIYSMWTCKALRTESGKWRSWAPLVGRAISFPTRLEERLVDIYTIFGLMLEVVTTHWWWQNWQLSRLLLHLWNTTQKEATYRPNYVAALSEVLWGEPEANHRANGIKYKNRFGWISGANFGNVPKIPKICTTNSSKSAFVVYIVSSMVCHCHWRFYLCVPVVWRNYEWCCSSCIIKLWQSAHNWWCHSHHTPYLQTEAAGERFQTALKKWWGMSPPVWKLVVTCHHNHHIKVAPMVKVSVNANPVNASQIR